MAESNVAEISTPGSQGAIGDERAHAEALALIEPAILIIMGVVVVFILISLYLPIFSLGQANGM